jgi:hypothetical protein
VAGVRNRRAIRWLRSQLPELVASGVISSEDARAIDGYYEHDQPRGNFAFVILAALGSALVAAGIILLIAHNWDDLSRATRTGVAFLPLLIAQALVVFTLMRRNESRPWREAAAIFDVAAVATAISLISQTYQVHMVVIEHRDRLSVAHQSWRDCVCNWLRSVGVCAVGDRCVGRKPDALLVSFGAGDPVCGDSFSVGL